MPCKKIRKKRIKLWSNVDYNFVAYFYSYFLSVNHFKSQLKTSMEGLYLQALEFEHTLVFRNLWAQVLAFSLDWGLLVLSAPDSGDPILKTIKSHHMADVELKLKPEPESELEFELSNFRIEPFQLRKHEIKLNPQVHLFHQEKKRMFVWPHLPRLSRKKHCFMS